MLELPPNGGGGGTVLFSPWRGRPIFTLHMEHSTMDPIIFVLSLLAAYEAGVYYDRSAVGYLVEKVKQWRKHR